MPRSAKPFKPSGAYRSLEKYSKAHSMDHGPPDLACTRCRERKIRCGREKPTCGNCSRDEQASCVYQLPAKRINHLKRLSENIDGLQDRFSSIEAMLEQVDRKLHGAGGVGGGAWSDGEHSASRTPFPETSKDSPASTQDSSDHIPAMDGAQVYRTDPELIDLYHGPWSLFALCCSFRQRILNSPHDTATQEPVLRKLSIICEAAGASDPFPQPLSETKIQLPPRQQAIEAISHFLQHVDHTTDVFVPSNLLANLDRVYANGTSPVDEIWAICFRSIIVLAACMQISAHGNHTLIRNFAHSFLPSRAALINSHLLMAPRLINVQTLILLSVAVQHVDSSTWSEVLFSQACMLARIMGLHHLNLPTNKAGECELAERAKALQVLYIRDKSSSIMRGTASKLHSDDCDISSQLEVAADPMHPHTARLQLAMLQEDVYTWLHSSRNKPGRHPSIPFGLIEHKLEQCAQLVGIATPVETLRRPQNILLHLEFLATRILAYRYLSSPEHNEQMLSDVRASCLLLIVACGCHDSRDLSALATLLVKTPRGQLTPLETGNCPLGVIANSNSSLFSVLDNFSIPAFFILLEQLVQPSDAAQHGGDLALLQRVSSCFRKATKIFRSNPYHMRLAHIVEEVTGLVNISGDTILTPPSTAPIATMTTSPTVTAISFTDPGVACQNPNATAWPTPPAGVGGWSWQDWPTMDATFTSENSTWDLDQTDGGPKEGHGDILAQLLGSPLPSVS